MVPALFFYQLVLLALLWLWLLLQWAWPSDSAAACLTTPELPSPVPKRHREPQPFVGLTTQPYCDACEHLSAPHPQTHLRQGSVIQVMLCSRSYDIVGSNTCVDQGGSRALWS
jgi:hypothetical protein